MDALKAFLQFMIQSVQQLLCLFTHPIYPLQRGQNVKLVQVQSAGMASSYSLTTNISFLKHPVILQIFVENASFSCNTLNSTYLLRICFFLLCH